MPDLVMIVPIEFLPIFAEQDAHSVHIRGTGGDHAEQPLTRQKAEKVRRAPTGEGVGLDVDGNPFER